jgi:hypothetical protein
MKKAVLFIILFTAISLSAQTNTERVKVGHTYNISVPTIMMRTYTLVNGAKLQYQNGVKNIYLVVIDESKEELKELGVVCKTVEDYYETITKDYPANYKDYKQISKRNIKSNGNKIIQTEYQYTSGDSTGTVEIYFCQDYVETEKYFYKVACWTILANIEKYRPLMREISKSIKED